ncbi:MAG: lytic transglycosylase domain-containing protein [Deltaproteobacteria bacterium]|nr:lytic transglycosylase domain-containing protein [Deltaproteobacteria bacterium]
MANRRRKRKGFGPARKMKAFLGNWLVQRTALVLLVFVLVVNGIIALLGASGSHLLSPFHLENKVRAIGFFACHVVSQAGQPPLPKAEDALMQAVQRYRVPRRVVFAFAKVESGLVPHRVSHTGAMGLMQLMPDTALDLGVDDPFHPLDNAFGGVKYLSHLWTRYKGDLPRIAAAYNYGPGRVPRTGAYRLPAETRRYVKRVMTYAKM